MGNEGYFAFELGWGAGRGAPTHGDRRLWEYQEKPCVAIGVPLHAGLAVAGCCPSFAFPLSGARHIAHSNFIY